MTSSVRARGLAMLAVFSASLPADAAVLIRLR
jgi:hypothetical protein